MTDDNKYTIEKPKRKTKKVLYENHKIDLTEQEVRKLASQLPENTEQQKVSDCCGAGIRVADKFTGWVDCKSCGKPCDAVEPEEKCPSKETHDTAHNIINYFLQRGARVSKEDYDWLIEKINNE